MPLYTADVWKVVDGWEFANRYHFVNTSGPDEQGLIAQAFVTAERASLDSRVTITKVNVAPVPNPGSTNFVTYPVGDPGERNMGANPPCAPEICIWVSPKSGSGLLGRKTYRQMLQYNETTRGGNKPAYNPGLAVLTTVAESWTLLLENLAEVETTLRIGVRPAAPSGRVVTDFVVRERPMFVDVNHAWYNIGPTP